MKVLVTGANGFVGPWLVRRLMDEGHEVVTAIGPGGNASFPPGAVSHVTLDLNEAASVAAAVSTRCDAVVHLAAVASGGAALEDPAAAWTINAVGTARLAEALGAQRINEESDPLLLVVSTAEVYGAGRTRPRREDDPPRPCSPYAASKLAAETAALEVHRRTGLRVIIARPFSHTGRGQDDRFVVPAFARRMVEAKRIGAAAIKVGNLEPVRELLYVGDVVRAYTLLLSQGASGEIYNIAAGHGIPLGELVQRLMEIVGHPVVTETDARFLRPSDIPHLVGDGKKLSQATGWRPEASLDDVLREVVDAQAN